MFKLCRVINYHESFRWNFKLFHFFATPSFLLHNECFCLNFNNTLVDLKNCFLGFVSLCCASVNSVLLQEIKARCYSCWWLCFTESVFTHTNYVPLRLQKQYNTFIPGNLISVVCIYLMKLSLYCVNNLVTRGTLPIPAAWNTAVPELGLLDGGWAWMTGFGTKETEQSFGETWQRMQTASNLVWIGHFNWEVCMLLSLYLHLITRFFLSCYALVMGSQPSTLGMRCFV